ncbi:stage V sporulation T C-terminal domain-containing protein [Agathobacter sp.]
MKATGLTRRVDSLGRVVIPKELRKVLHIQEGSPLEIYMDGEEGIVLKKYSPVGELKGISQAYADSLAQISGGLVCISDRDEIIAAAGRTKKNYEGKKPSKELDTLMENRQQATHCKKNKDLIRVVDDDDCDYYGQAVASIINDGDCAGAVVLCSRDEKDYKPEIEQKLVATAAGFLSRQIG